MQSEYILVEKYPHFQVYPHKTVHFGQVFVHQQKTFHIQNVDNLA